MDRVIKAAPLCYVSLIETPFTCSHRPVGNCKTLQKGESVGAPLAFGTESAERKQDAANLPLERCFISAQTIESEVWLIRQRKEAFRSVAVGYFILKAIEVTSVLGVELEKPSLDGRRATQSEKEAGEPQNEFTLDGGLGVIVSDDCRFEGP